MPKTPQIAIFLAVDGANPSDITDVDCSVASEKGSIKFSSNVQIVQNESFFVDTGNPTFDARAAINMTNRQTSLQNIDSKKSV